MSPKLPLSGKVIAVTGAASRIGLATAHLHASRGETLSLADLQGAALTKTAAEIKAIYETAVHTLLVDIRKHLEVDAWIAEIIEKFRRLDGAANMAGVIGKSLVSAVLQIRMRMNGILSSQ